jgi:alkyl sulfatase BDS1-like metallo-beta-lactamase superfamily hydrolase
LFDPGAAHGFTATIALRLGENHFRIKVAHGQLHLTRGEPEHTVATLETDPQTLAALLYGGRPLQDVLRTGEVTIAGDGGVLARFLQLFPIPEPAGAP